MRNLHISWAVGFSLGTDIWGFLNPFRRAGEKGIKSSEITNSLHEGFVSSFCGKCRDLTFITRGCWKPRRKSTRAASPPLQKLRLVISRQLSITSRWTDGMDTEGANKGPDSHPKAWWHSLAPGADSGWWKPPWHIRACVSQRVSSTPRGGSDLEGLI